jgi:methylamine dehydrogenase light chain
MDGLFELLTRKVAQHTSRRSFIAMIGRAVAGGVTVGLLPLLPIDRSARAAEPGTPNEPGDPTSCDYWRYCAIDGYLCTCCGGGPHQCPPGSTPSPTSWVGTCKHPTDGRDYIIAYRDCCGQAACGRCLCANTQGESPIYRPQLNSDFIWCLGAPSMVYHCSEASIVGVKS